MIGDKKLACILVSILFASYFLTNVSFVFSNESAVGVPTCDPVWENGDEILIRIGDRGFEGHASFVADKSQFYKTVTVNPTPLLLTEVYYDTYLSYEPEEYVKIYNPQNWEVNISGWIVTDQEGSLTFPPGTFIEPCGEICITKNASAFQVETCAKPDFEYGVDSDPAVPQMETSGSFILANDGDEVILKNNFNQTIDVIVYGNITYTGPGWNGVTVRDVGEGRVLKRNKNETTGNYVDTNTSADWETIRRYYVGQSDFSYKEFNFTGNVTLFASPDSSFEAIIKELDNAACSIYLNLYVFSNPYLSEKLVSASKRGVDVKVFLEGNPAFGLANETKYIAKQLYENGSEVRFMITNDSRDIHDRYRYEHAKYCVIDNNSVIVMSENWGYTGVPVNNTFGNRGWGIVVRNSSVAEYFADVFFEDFNPAMKDSYAFTPGDPEYGEPPAEFIMNYTIPTGNYVPSFNSTTIEGSFNISPVLAPDHTVLQTKSIINMINSAEESIYIELLACDKNWTWYGDYYPNMYLDAAVDAARRGCKVRVLLDSKYNKDNWETVQELNNLSLKEGLDLIAQMADLDSLKLDKIHNKGIIVDGKKTLISSINWGFNSVINNREAGVIVENTDVANYFLELFLQDWQASEFTIKFEPGWNLVTLPLNPILKYTAESLGKRVSGCTHLATWNTSSQQFIVHEMNTEINDFEIRNGIGYFIFVNASSSLTVCGYEFSKFEIELAAGWNSIGWLNSTTANAEFLISQISNCTATAAWNPYAQRFAVHPKGKAISNFAVERGKGYLVYLTTPAVWEMP